MFRSLFDIRIMRSVRRRSRRRSEQIELLEIRSLLTSPLSSVPALSSFPGAPVTVYLDFDGHTENDPSWTSGSIVTTAYDNDLDPATFSDDELRRIEEIWYRVAEDFAPLNINVTTVEPAAVRDFESIRVVMGGNGSWYGPPSGGVSLVNSFNNSQSNTCFIFTDNIQDELGRGAVVPSAMNATHETGHTFGLAHHSRYDAGGNKIQEYHPGNAIVGPLMGAAFYSDRNTWNNGPGDISATLMQDDLAILTGAANRVVAFRADDFANSRETAGMFASGQTSISGVIERNDDVDWFRFETTGGALNLNAEGLNLRTIYGNAQLNPGTNLDIVLGLYDAAGNPVAESNPGDSLFASITRTVTSGIWFVRVSGTGEYGSLGRYTLTASVESTLARTSMTSPGAVVQTLSPEFTWNPVDGAVSFELVVRREGSDAIYYRRIVSGTSHISAVQFGQGSFVAQVRALGTDGSVADWSDPLRWTLDLPTPAAPVILLPAGVIQDQTPRFAWTTTSHAVAWNLWVNDVALKTPVVNVTGLTSTEYSVPSSLPEGSYRVWAQSVNELGERSAWGAFSDFQIVIPPPDAPELTGPAVVVNTQQPIIEWMYRASTNLVQLEVRNSISEVVFGLQQEDSINSNHKATPPSLPQGNYSVRIRAQGVNGKWSEWSPGRDFSVDILPPAAPVITGPAASNNGTVVTSTTPEFQWTATDRATSWDLWVNHVTSGKAQIIRETALTTNSFKAGHLPQGNYQVWVRGINAAGEPGAWSGVRTFVIDEPVPRSPVLISPAISANGKITTAVPEFRWNATVSATTYEVRIDDLTQYGSTVIYQKGITGTSWTVPVDLRLKEHSYLARVRAVNSSGEASAWSAVIPFRVDMPSPAAPDVISPRRKFEAVAQQFRWTRSSSDFRYELQIRDIDRKVEMTVSVDVYRVNPAGNEVTFVLPDVARLAPGRYRFWVRAFNAAGEASRWSRGGALEV